MRGAVLHGLDLDIVDRRVMRRSYGTQLADVFNPKIHPHTRKFIDELDGSERCTVAKWYAKKVKAPSIALISRATPCLRTRRGDLSATSNIVSKGSRALTR